MDSREAAGKASCAQPSRPQSRCNPAGGNKRRSGLHQSGPLQGGDLRHRKEDLRVVGHAGHKRRFAGGDAPLMYRGALCIENRQLAEGALGVTMPSAVTSPARHCRRVSRITTSAPTPSSDFRSTPVNISADRRRRNQRRHPVLRRPQAKCSASCACHSSHAANRASTRASSA